MTAVLEQPLAPRSRSRSIRRWKRTSRPRCAATVVTTCGSSCRTATTTSSTSRSPISPRMLRAGRRVGREHLGDDPRRDRRHAARRSRRPHPLLHRAARRPLARRSARAGRRHDVRRSSTTSPASTSRSPAAVSCICSNGSPARSGLWLASPHLASSVLDHLAALRRTDPLQARARQLAAARVPADLRRRAGQRGDAERVAPVHRRARRRPRAPRHHDRADPLAHGRLVARSARDAVSRALPRHRRHRRARQRRAPAPVGA